MRLTTIFTLVATIAFCASARSQAAIDFNIYDETRCGSLKNAYGPYDYRTQTAEEKDLVESVHFTTSTEQLKGTRYADGTLRNSSGNDIDYTLRAFPNHPRALIAMMRLQGKEQKLKPSGARWPVPCYFERAVRFTPDDGSVRMVLGIYLLKFGDKTGAVHELELARKLLGDEPNVCYNLGLAYFEVGRYDEAMAMAKRAREMGFDLQGLQKKLKQAGKWVD